MTKMSHNEFADREVERLFKQHQPMRGEPCHNPVTGTLYAAGIDPIRPQKNAARRALLARQWHIFDAPFDVQPLPLSMSEWDQMQRRGTLLHYICVKYAQSLEAQDYDFRLHPSFDDYVAGYLWDAEEGPGIADISHHPREQLEELKKRYPPRKLEGFGSGSTWSRPKRTRGRPRRAAREVQHALFH